MGALTTRRVTTGSQNAARNNTEILHSAREVQMPPMRLHTEKRPIKCEHRVHFKRGCSDFEKRALAMQHIGCGKQSGAVMSHGCRVYV